MTSIYFLPHGGAIVPELEGPLKKDGIKLNSVMKDIAEEIRSEGIQLIILTSPHGYVHPEDYLIYFHNVFESWNIIQVDGGSSVKRNLWMGNLQVAQILDQKFRENNIRSSPLVLGDPNFPLKIAWGATIPLSFIAGAEGPQVVIFSLPMKQNSNKADRVSELNKLGQTLKELLESDIFNEVKVSLVISGDLSHKHDPNHHYGYHENSKEFDEISVKWMEENSNELLDKLYDLEETAAPCGLMGMNILQGIFNNDNSWKNKSTHYGLPTYFGMAVASWKKDD